MNDKILVIEDHPVLRENLRELLEAEDYRVSVASNGQEGLAVARAQAPDLILCDVSMPVLDGLGLVEAVRADALLATTPVLMLSAFTERDTVRRAMVLGADDYVTKPFTPEELLEAIAAQLVKRTRRTQEAGRATEALRASVLRSLPHELRTPLSGILGLTTLLQQRAEKMTPAQVRVHADAILKSGRRLEALVQRYLLFTELRAEATLDRWPLPVEPLDLDAGMLRVESPAGHEIRRDIEPARLAASADALRFVLEELVGNAAKFAPAGTPIEVVGRIADGAWHLSVSNRGPALPPDAERALDAWVQFDRASHEQQGAGLGLAICRLLLLRHGGDLRVDDASGDPVRLTARFPLA